MPFILFEADAKDLIAIFGEPTGECMAAYWKLPGLCTLEYTGIEYDEDEIPEGQVEYMVTTKRFDRVVNKIHAAGYQLEIIREYPECISYRLVH